MLNIYKYFIYLLVPIIKLNLFIRAKRNKEEKYRIPERYGVTKNIRPKGNLIWIHACSVGEFNSATGLINKLLEKNIILLTTSTVSAYYYSKKIFNNRIIHQYAPIDHTPWVQNFIEYWNPKMVIWIESDLWPNTIRIIYEKKINSFLLNLRLSPKSFKRWELIKKSFSKLIESFDLVFAQSKNDLEKINKLTSKKVNYIGNLKLTSLPKILDTKKLSILKKNIVNKKIILIASSHPNEENLILETLKNIEFKNKNIFVIIVPRHPNRSIEVLSIVKKYFPKSSIESSDNFTWDIDCFISDSLGEMEIYYHLSDIVILGGSFVNIGGHNPIEPASHYCSILTGPSIFNWQNIYEEMNKEKACVNCNSLIDLKNNIKLILKNINIEQSLKENAFRFSKKKQNIIENILFYIDKHMETQKDA